MLKKGLNPVQDAMGEENQPRLDIFFCPLRPPVARLDLDSLYNALDMVNKYLAAYRCT